MSFLINPFWSATGGSPLGIGAMAIIGNNITAQDFTGAGGAAVTFDDTLYDEGGWWSAGAPTRLTVPSGVSYVALSATVTMTNYTPQIVAAVIYFAKNGSITFDGASGFCSFSSEGSHAFTGVLPASAGDYFEIFFKVFSDTSVDLVADQCFFSTEVVS
jgi:hypothetical protein